MNFKISWNKYLKNISKKNSYTNTIVKIPHSRELERNTNKAKACTFSIPMGGENLPFPLSFCFSFRSRIFVFISHFIPPSFSFSISLFHQNPKSITLSSLLGITPHPRYWSLSFSSSFLPKKQFSSYHFKSSMVYMAVRKK